MFMNVRINEMKNDIDTDMRNAVKTVEYFLLIFMHSFHYLDRCAICLLYELAQCTQQNISNFPSIRSL